MEKIPTVVVLHFVFTTFVICSLDRPWRASCDENNYVDGCSIPFGLPAPFETSFRQACNRHDICYSCRHRPKWNLTKEVCDQSFKFNMKKVCKSKPFFTRIPCRIAAEVYYFWVDNRYEGPSTSDRWCDYRWVSKCLPSKDEIDHINSMTDKTDSW